MEYNILNYRTYTVVHEKQYNVTMVEDSSRSTIYVHLNTNNGQGLIAKDEAHALFQKNILSRRFREMANTSSDVYRRTQSMQLTELLCFDGIYHQHQTGKARIYKLSAGAKIVYNDYCTHVIEN